MSTPAPPDPSPPRPEGATLAKRAGVVALFTLSSRVLGFARDGVLGHVFGAGVAYDAFVAAQTIPNALRRLVAEGSLVIAFVPLLSAEKARGGEPAMRAFTGAVLGALLPVLALLCGLGVLFPEALVEAFAAGFGPERRALAVDLTRIMMPYLFFISLTALAGGALNVQGRFAAPAAAPVLLNLAIIVAALVAAPLVAVPMEAVAWGVVAGGALQLLLQVPFLLRAGLLVGPRWAPSDPALRTLVRRMIPAVFGVGVYQLNLVVIRQIASFMPEGQLSCYYVGTRLQEFALGVFAVSISIAALPTLSDHAARGDRPAVFATFRRALKATNFITVPAMAGLIVLSGPIVGVLFRHGSFSAQDARLTATLLEVLAVALVPIGAVRVLVPTYYAIGDTRTPVAAAAASLVTTGLAGWGLARALEIEGLTWATALGAAAQVVVLGALLRRRVRAAVDPAAGAPPPPPAPRGTLDVVGHAARCLLAVAPVAAAAGLWARRFDWYGGFDLLEAAHLGGLLTAFGVGYLALAHALGIGEVALLVSMVRRRIPGARR